jgi:hypothetical protein
MSLVFFDGNLVWSQENETTKIAVLLSDDGEEKAPHLRALARIALEGSDAVLSIEGVDFILKADHLGVRLTRCLHCADGMERNRALHDTAESMRTNFGLRLRRISEKHIRPIAA